MMVVVVTSGGPEPLVTVNKASEDAPGYARAEALVTDAAGGTTWSRCIVSSPDAMPEVSLVGLPAGNFQPISGGAE